MLKLYIVLKIIFNFKMKTNLFNQKHGYFIEGITSQPQAFERTITERYRKFSQVSGDV